MNMIMPDVIKQMKARSEPITLLTAYGYPMARIFDDVGIDIILVGDSVANTELGLESTKYMTMDEMIHHAKAVSRAVRKSLLVGDMPFESYQKDISKAAANAKRFINEAGCGAVKVEWFKYCPEVVRDILDSGIAVMGHIGLTPQTADELGGLKVQGKDVDAANKIIEQAVVLSGLGVFSLVLECVPDVLAKIITETVDIPTIGIGAGPYCDGQALVSYDMLGITRPRKPKFVKQYADIYSQIENAARNYKDEVKRRVFPDREHMYTMNPEEALKLRQSKSKG
ncbi:MAG: 3-methyl-2-oxobutanoate hydroxymethyltransferase [Candidatus Omnitrophica bacterium]|nr:3-methyl-2-oxobutanoate hydroxymethyltransferase [Candidatus Omnitrophota bacterium]